ncbi:MAG: ABC transporter permease, partial [Pseudomonadota bacterium]
MKGRALATRLAQALPVVVGVVVISFLLTRALPGDPAVYFAGAAADAESIAQVRAELGLDQPLGDILPKFANMQVLVDPEGPLDNTVPAERPITIRQLLTHTSG